jgi:RimJ/RimL family protein N-acetyltransferase
VSGARKGTLGAGGASDWPPMRALATAALTLEPQGVEHAEAMARVLADPALYAHEGEPPPSLQWLRERYAKLESRRSPDGRDAWLNWVLRPPGGEPIGYVQATVSPAGHAAVAYVLGSAHWGRGLAAQAVQAMLDELAARWRVRTFHAVLKAGNARSRRLLERLGFVPAPPALRARHAVADDELMMVRKGVR